MTTILCALDIGEEITIGNAGKIYTADDGTIAARLEGSGLTSHFEKKTKAGLLRILEWIDLNS